MELDYDYTTISPDHIRLHKGYGESVAITNGKITLGNLEASENQSIQATLTSKQLVIDDKNTYSFSRNLA